MKYFVKQLEDTDVLPNFFHALSIPYNAWIDHFTSLDKQGIKYTAADMYIKSTELNLNLPKYMFLNWR